MQYSNNYFGQTPVQNKKIKEIKSRHIILSEYLTEVFDYMRTQGVDIVLHTVPSIFNHNGDRGAGWYGNIDGTITNHNNDHELYADSMWGGCFNEFKDNEPIINLITGGGNGGSSFAYDDGFIAVETLPLLKKKMYAEIEISKATTELNHELSIIESDFKLNIVESFTKKQETSSDYIFVSSKITQVENLLNELKRAKSEIETQFTVESTIENSVALPEIEDSLLDLTEYHKVQRKLNQYDKSDLKEIDISETANKIYEVVNEFPHKFI